MPDSAKAIGYLELNSKQFDDSIALAKKALVGLGAAFAAVKTVDFWKDGIEGAIKFGNEAYFAAQKLNGYDPGKLFLVQKALQAGGLAAEDARKEIEEFGRAGKPLETLFKGGSAGFADALARSAKEYGTQAAVLSKSAEEFAYVQGQITAVGTKLEGFFLGLTDRVAAPLSGLLAQIDRIDLVGMGERFGGYVVDAINVIRGLIENRSLFDALSLSVKVGFQEASNYLLGAVNSVIGILTSSDTWAGLATTLVGVLGVVGSFLTSLFLGVGKLFVAAIQSAVEQLREKYSFIKNATDLHLQPVERAAAFAAGAEKAIKNGTPETAVVEGNKMVAALQTAIDQINKKQNYSTDVATNLKNNENNSAIVALNQLTAAQLKTSEAVAKGGIIQLAGEKPTFQKANLYDTTKDAKSLSDLIQAALKSGQAAATALGTKNPLYSEKADPYHVIADSLAKVGGGGRYVRVGLSIADKAALDSLRFQQQQLVVQRQIEKNTAKKTPTTPMGGG